MPFHCLLGKFAAPALFTRTTFATQSTMLASLFTNQGYFASLTSFGLSLIDKGEREVNGTTGTVGAAKSRPEFNSIPDSRTTHSLHQCQVIQISFDPSASDLTLWIREEN